MTIGLVIGKFYPPHAGHQFLIETAVANSDQLYIIICHKVTETPSGELRQNWIAELYLDAKVILLLDDNYDSDDSELWAKLTIDCIKNKPDVVFTSENYGTNYSHYLGCRHHLVDLDRLKFPISGTIVRADPYGNWRFLSKPVRRYYTKRVVIVGSESTGKTVLSQKLAAYFGVRFVSEVGREVSEERMIDATTDYHWSSQDFVEIATKQNEREDLCAENSNGMIICDTNSLATYIWHTRYMNFDYEKLMDIYLKHRDRHIPELFILTKHNVPFVQDGYRDGEHIRGWMFVKFVSVLTKLGISFHLLDSENYEDRTKQAIDILID